MRDSERLERQAEEAETVAAQLSHPVERQALMRFARDWRKLADKARGQEARAATG